MVFDMGLTGLGIVAALALGFGLVAQLVTWRTGTRWMWLVAAVAWFVGAVFVSQVMFATYTEDEMIIDGLAFDEALLGGLVVGLAVALATWFATRQLRRESTSA